MMPESPSGRRLLGYVALAFASGLCFPFQSRANGGLAEVLGSGTAAATVSFGGGLILLMIGALAVPGFRRATVALRDAAGASQFPRWYLCAGVLGAILVFAQSTAVPMIGVALVSVAVIAGQTTSGLAVDRLGFGTGMPRPLSGDRVAGVVITIVAVGWSVAGSVKPETGWFALLVVLLPLVAGVGNGFQQAMNGAITRATGHPFAATFANFTAGTVALGAALALQAPFVHFGGTGPLQWWMFMGGPLGIVFIAASAYLVPRVGVLLVTVTVVAGQLFGSLLIDLVFPTSASEVSPMIVGVLALTVIAVAMTSGLIRSLWARRRPHQ